MRLLPLTALTLLLFACVHDDSPPISSTNAAPPPSVVEREESLPERHTPRPEVCASPFLPALARAGLWPPQDSRVIRSIECCGTITVEGHSYFVLYIDSYLQLNEYNERGSSRWMVCDTAMRPVWENPDWGGKPGACSGNQVKVNLTDKFFEIHDGPGWGDLITFHKDGNRLSASVDWASDESRIAQFLNWPKRRHDCHEPDERVTQILPVAGHPDWRIVLTQFTLPLSQGCARLIALDESGEFGCKSLPGIWSDQACRPVDAGSVQLPHTGDTLVWIKYTTRGGWRYIHRAILRDGDCISLGEDEALGHWTSED